MSEQTAPAWRKWLPWAILALLLILILIMPRIGYRGDPLAKRTKDSGLPLTEEQKSVRFDSADLALEILPSKQAITGVATNGLTVIKPISKIQFDLDPRYDISSVKVGGTDIAKGQWSNPDGQLTINLPQPAKAGDQLKIAIAYSGKPHVAKRAPWDGGFVWSHTKGGQPWVASAVQGEGCDMFWPCFDNSLVEVGAVTQHLTVPKGLTAASNGKLLGTDTLADGRTRWNWVAKSPNNYAIAINVGPYKLASADHKSRYGNSFPIDFWYMPGHEKQAAKLLDEMGRTVDFFEARIGPYPFASEKMGVVETPHLGMEHQTINAYGNDFKLSPYGFDWLFNHEFAHEWFGNQLTNKDWDDMWLHEGFGSYLQPLTAEWGAGQMGYLTNLWEQRQSIANKNPVVFGKSRTEEETYNNETGSGGDIYYKGSWILHTLRGYMGDEAFFRSIRRIVYGRPDPLPGNFAPRFGTSDEYQQIVSQETGKNMDWFFNVYLRQAALPRLVESRSGNTLNLQWKTPKGLPFPMPIDVAVDGKVQTVAMTGGRGSVTLPSPNSIVTIDPASKVLRQNDAMDAYRDWPGKPPRRR